VPTTTSEQIAEYERCLVAGLKARPGLVDELRVRLEDFTHRDPAELFRAIDAIRLSGRQVDDVAVYQEARGVPVAFIATLPEAAAANARWYLDRLRESNLRRRIRAASGRIAELVARDDLDCAEILEGMDLEITALGDSERSEILWLKDILRPAVEDIQRRAANPSLACTGIPSGYWDLDHLTDGFQPGELVIIAARPSIGKTALAVSLIVNMSVRGEHKGGLFSCEMSEVLIAQRFLANVGQFDLGMVRRGSIVRSDGNRLLEAASALYHEQVLVNATPNVKLGDLKGMARSMVRRGGAYIFVDYLTLIQHGDSRTPRHERVGEISKQLKGLARELNVPVIALSQLARTAEGKEPSLAELRQSGEIEEDADLVMLLHRERDETLDAVPTQLIVAKNRNGPCGTVRMIFRPRYGRFELEAQR